MKLNLVVLVLVLMTGSIKAQNVPGFTYMMPTPASCEAWTAYRHDDAAGADEYWILGFLTGVGSVGAAAAREGQVLDPLRGTDAQSVWAWIDNYCQAHPLEAIKDAAMAFVVAHPR